ncbi:SRPBCC family protein [Paludisphaera mucosa]|uniref:SRPBCC family protein n=1 Tax=Paludisphaera mucosa TaxID=3030827 RepID=A0ABT6F6R1_9BACT|nr:SRPBCC family protein [Paludisphaera mucosa]MDG3003209.1 SRPBCC family protein [Paludisphaera mucosa]
MRRFIKESRIDASPADVFAFFERPDAFDRLIPPGEPVEVVQAPNSLEVGTQVVIRTRLGPLPIEWAVEHIEYEPGRLFVDRQIRGPFASWTHRHEFADDGRCGTLLRDVIDYAPPLGLLGAMIGGRFLEHKLQKLFDHRHEVIRAVFQSAGGTVVGSA